MASVMLVLCGVATLAGPNGTAPALENGRIEINPPPFPTGIELNLSRATGLQERTALALTMRVMRCVPSPARPAHTHTAPQAGGSSPVCVPRRWKPSGGRPRGPPATALVQWWQTTRGSTTALLAALVGRADEPREVELNRRQRVGIIRGFVVTVEQSGRQSREQCRGLQLFSWYWYVSVSLRLQAKGSERRSEPGRVCVEESRSIQESPEAERGSPYRSSSCSVQVMNTFTPTHCTVSRVTCRRRWRVAEDERATDPGGVCVEESQEIQECREAREESQSPGVESSLQADMSCPPMLGVEGGASNTRAVGPRRVAGVAQPETRESQRKEEEREGRAARQSATTQRVCEEGGGYVTNRPIGYRVMCREHSHLVGEAATPQYIQGGEEVRKTRPIIGAHRRRDPIGGQVITEFIIRNTYILGT